MAMLDPRRHIFQVRVPTSSSAMSVPSVPQALIEDVPGIAETGYEVTEVGRVGS